MCVFLSLCLSVSLCLFVYLWIASRLHVSVGVRDRVPVVRGRDLEERQHAVAEVIAAVRLRLLAHVAHVRLHAVRILVAILKYEEQCFIESESCVSVPATNEFTCSFVCASSHCICLILRTCATLVALRANLSWLPELESVMLSGGTLAW